MKMNIKGLVFVGFAAAVFASAANAADKIVTSKTYVDTKYVAAENGNITITPNATTGKNEISADVPVKGVKEFGADSPITPVNGIVELPEQQAAGTGTLSVTVGSANAVNFSANEATGNTVSVNVPVKSGAGEGLVPSTGANDADKFLKSDGSWDTPDNTEYTFAEGANDGDFKYSTDGSTYTEVHVKNAEVTTNMIQDIDANSTQTTKYPSAKAVYDFVTDDDRQSDWAETTPTAPSFIKNKPGFSENGTAITPDANGVYDFTDTNTEYTFAEGANDGDFKYSTDGSTYTEVHVKNAEVTTNMIQDIAANSTQTTKYPSAKAVYDFLNNGATAAGCSDTTPCALVLGSGAPEWKLIQQ